MRVDWEDVFGTICTICTGLHSLTPYLGPKNEETLNQISKSQLSDTIVPTKSISVICFVNDSSAQFGCAYR